MSNAQHTRGPWKVADYIVWPANGGNAQFPVHAPKRGRIALALNREADARLISAAPELLEALWVATQHNALHFGENHNTVIQGRAAIAKATGERA